MIRNEAALKALMPFSGMEPWVCLPSVLNFSQRMLFSAISIIVPSSLPASGTRIRSLGGRLSNA